MSEQFRVFVASPGDVKGERDIFPRVVEEVNQTQGDPLGYRLELVRWETHAAPGAGRPQQVINDLIGPYNIFVGIMWRRFGTPSGVAGSGTEEEFRIAYSAWEKDPSLVIMFYFCQKPFMPQKVDELDQVRQVLLFRQELQGKTLAWDYDSVDSFERDMRKHLCVRLPRLLEERKNKTRSRTEPNDETIRVFKDLWSRMSPDLQKAFSVAYNENRRAGDAGVQTRDLFSALLRIGSPSLLPIVEEIPVNALPQATSGAVAEDPYIIQERPWLSGCVASSVRRLSTKLPPGRVLTAADIFADIAKNGSGESVRLLRKHNIGPDEIDMILRKKNIQVVGA